MPTSPACPPPPAVHRGDSQRSCPLYPRAGGSSLPVSAVMGSPVAHLGHFLRTGEEGVMNGLAVTYFFHLSRATLRPGLWLRAWAPSALFSGRVRGSHSSASKWPPRAWRFCLYTRSTSRRGDSSASTGSASRSV